MRALRKLCLRWKLCFLEFPNVYLLQIRPPLTRTHKIVRDESGKHNLLLILTGSIAVMKAPELISELYEKIGRDRILIKVCDIYM